MIANITLAFGTVAFSASLFMGLAVLAIPLCGLADIVRDFLPRLGVKKRISHHEVLVKLYLLIIAIPPLLGHEANEREFILFSLIGLASFSLSLWHRVDYLEKEIEVRYDRSPHND